MDILVQVFGALINSIYGFTGDYGVAIVIITIAIRTCMVPLNVKQRRQVKKQREISREVELIKAQYGNNKKKMEQELQKLYANNHVGMGSCLLPFLQLPIMYGLYNAIRLVALAGATTVLLPWVASILLRDHMLILPIATIVIQILPQTYPYLRFFKDLELQKAPLSSILVILLANSVFVFAIPSGIGLYYLVSGLFGAVEQFVVNVVEVQQRNRACKA